MRDDSFLRQALPCPLSPSPVPAGEAWGRSQGQEQREVEGKSERGNEWTVSSCSRFPALSPSGITLQRMGRTEIEMKEEETIISLTLSLFQASEMSWRASPSFFLYHSSSLSFILPVPPIQDGKRNVKGRKDKGKRWREASHSRFVIPFYLHFSFIFFVHQL